MPIMIAFQITQTKFKGQVVLRSGFHDNAGVDGGGAVCEDERRQRENACNALAWALAMGACYS